MPNINVEVSEELLKAVRLTCVHEGVTQRDWIARVLGEAVEEGVIPNAKLRQPTEVTGEHRAEKTSARPLAAKEKNLVAPAAETATCKRCEGEVRRDPKRPKFWRCEVCKRQLDDQEVRL
jgi:hypothetical protein